MLRLTQANTNEINRDIHLANTLFYLGNGMYYNFVGSL